MFLFSHCDQPQRGQAYYASVISPDVCLFNLIKPFRQMSGASKLPGLYWFRRPGYAVSSVSEQMILCRLADILDSSGVLFCSVHHYHGAFLRQQRNLVHVCVCSGMVPAS